MPSDSVQLSKFLSFVLRHKPEAIGLTLDSQGWASIDELIDKGNVSGTQFNREDLLRVAETSDKKRFSVSADGQRIRAAQGHSVAVGLGVAVLFVQIGALSPETQYPCGFQAASIPSG